MATKRPPRASRNGTGKKSGQKSGKSVQKRGDVSVPNKEPEAPQSAPPPPFTVWVRPLASQTGKPFAAEDPAKALLAALNSSSLPAGSEPVLEWKGTRELAVLDVDYHDAPAEYRPAHAALDRTAASVSPRPLAFHRSHGGGYKLYYTSLDGYPADELASAAAVAWHRGDPVATFEVKRQSRHPGYPRGPERCGPLVESTPSTDLGGVVLGPDADGDLMTWDHPDVARWLEERGLEPGGRYPHTRCPIDPSPRSRRDPVVVVDKGVFCHHCQAHGIGDPRRPGFRFWRQLLGGTGSTSHRDDPLRLMVENFCHWRHAEAVLTCLYPLAPSVLRGCYSMYLRRRHGADDGRVGQVFNPDLDLYRTDKGWVGPDFTQNYSKKLETVVSSLPASWGWVKDARRKDGKKLAPVGVRVARLMEDRDTSPLGYPVIETHPGFDLGRLTRRGPRKEVYDSAIPADRLPRWLPVRDRLDPAAAWGVLDRLFPGVDRYYASVLLAARGAASAGLAQFPFVASAGPAGAGKSTTVAVVAGVLGGAWGNVHWTRDDLRFRSQLGDALGSGCLVLLDELVKLIETAGMHPRTGLNVILGTSRGQQYHKFHLGPARFTALPPLVVTDVSYPEAITSDAQIARRFTFVQLHRAVDWDKALADARVTEVALFRNAGEEYARAADSIASDFAERYFSGHATYQETLKRVAADHGRELDDPASAGRDRRTAVLHELFAAVCAAGSTPLTGGLASRWTGPGYIPLRRTDSGRLAEAWEQACDACTGGDWTSSRLAAEADWSRVLGTKEAVALDVAIDRDSLILLRFRTGPRRSPRAVNSCVRPQ